MNFLARKFSLVTIALFLVACDKKEGMPSVAPASDSQENTQFRGAPDFGGTVKVTREAEGIGSTPELAILSALQSAAMQVNGVRVKSQMQSMRTRLSLTVDGETAGSVTSDAFMQQVLSASSGTILGFEILSQQEINKVDEETANRVRVSDGGYSYKASAGVNYSESANGNMDAGMNANDKSGNGNSSSASFNANAKYNESLSYQESGNVNASRGKSSFSSNATTKKMKSYWKVRVKADIAQFKAPDEKGRPKIIVSLPRTLKVSYPVGDSSVASAEVANTIRARLTDMLTQTKRFIVLDREFGGELQAEINYINSGNVRLEDSARIGQQLSTDLILIPTIERFEYPKHVRKLRMSDREVVSYSGGARITLRLLNATTGEIVMSDSFDHSLASTGPSTLPRVVDGKGMAVSMMDSLSTRIGSAIVAEIFPVSVISLSGDKVVLSQGGDALNVGERWEAVTLGEELKDPQTGNSLGRVESPCCVITIDRVANQTSYGTIDNGSIDLAGMSFRPGLIELRAKTISDNKLVAKAEASSSSSASSTKQAVQAGSVQALKRPAAPKKEHAQVEQDAEGGDDNW